MYSKDPKNNILVQCSDLTAHYLQYAVKQNKYLDEPFASWYNSIPAAQSTAMPRMPLRPIPDVTRLRNPEPSGLMRLTPFCVATVLLKSHQQMKPEAMCTSTCKALRPARG